MCHLHKEYLWSTTHLPRTVHGRDWDINKGTEFSSWNCACTNSTIPQNIINIKIRMKKGEKMNGTGI